MTRAYLLNLVLFIAIIISGKVNAQATLGVRSLSFPDSVVANNEYTVSVEIENKGNQPYSGDIVVVYSTDSIRQYNFDTITVANFNPAATINVARNDFRFDQPAFLKGGNIVVVWPTGDVSTADSASVNVNVANSGARLGVHAVHFPDTVEINKDYTVSIEIENKGDEPYSGLVTVFYTVDSSNQQGGFFDAITVTNLNPSQIVNFIRNDFQFNQPAFMAGGNIVVVWPAGEVPTNDSASSPVYVNAQVVLGVSAVSFPDTVVENTNYTVEIEIENKGNDSYSGLITIYYAIDSIFTNLAVFDSVTVANLDPLEKVNISRNDFQFNAPHFLKGNNIVVVWPTGNFSTADSASAIVHVVDKTGIISNLYQLNSQVNIFPNPAKDKLFISFSEKNNLEQVRIYNIVGEEIFSSKENLHVVNISEYIEGIYFIELQFSKDKKLIKKFVKFMDSNR